MTEHLTLAIGELTRKRGEKPIGKEDLPTHLPQEPEHHGVQPPGGQENYWFYRRSRLGRTSDHNERDGSNTVEEMQQQAEYEGWDNVTELLVSRALMSQHNYLRSQFGYPALDANNPPSNEDVRKEQEAWRHFVKQLTAYWKDQGII